MLSSLLVRFLLLALLTLAIGIPSPLAGQEHPTGADATLRDLPAQRASEPVPVDGRLDHPVWEEGFVAADFVQRRPDSGAPATQRTEVRVLYDAENLYVGMRMYDDEPEAIAAPLGRRGATGLHSDWAHVVIDSYRNGRTAFRFAVNPAGVKRDVLHYNDVQEDDSWEAVWEAATRVDGGGWTAVLRIPFSQLRFSAGDGEMVWGINFMRDLAREDERSTWAPQPREAGRFVSLFGRLSGLRDLGTPRRLEVTPYLLVGTDHAPGGADSPFRGRTETFGDIGADLSYGLGSSLTLTATVNPDFGQVEVDPAVVNLSAFETFFPEQRPFFLEGSEIFRFPINFGDGGNESLFYTRRIGRSPQGSPPTGAVHTDAPTATRILGAAKLSGRTEDGWAIGALNAITRRESARWVDEEGTTGEMVLEPATNHAVLRLSRDLRDGESSIGGMGTSVHRAQSSGAPGFLANQAYTLGLDGRHRFGDGDWQAEGWVAGSHIRGDASAIEALQRAPARYFQRPDAGHVSLDPDRIALSGVAADLTVAKRAGQWRGGALVHVRSPGFDANETGFLQAADRTSFALWGGHVSYEAGRHLRSWNVFSNVYGMWSWGGERFLSGANVSGAFETRAGWGADGGVEGFTSSLDLRATRGGPALHDPPSTGFWANLYTDRRRTGYLELGMNGGRSLETGGGNLAIRPALTVRPAPRFRFSLGPNWARNLKPAQYVGQGETDGKTHHLFGHLAQTTVAMDARLDLTLSPELSLELFAQPFVSVGKYSEFRRVLEPRATDFHERFHTFVEGSELRRVGEDGEGGAWGYFPDGEGDVPAYTFQDPGFRVRSLRGNAVLRWEYRPGSTLFLVWQQERSLPGTGDRGLEFGRDMERLLRAPGEHVVALKVTYWLGG